MEELDNVVKEKSFEIENMNLKLNNLREKLKKVTALKDKLYTEESQKKQYEEENLSLAGSKKSLLSAAIVLIVLGGLAFIGYLAYIVAAAANGTELTEGGVKFLGFLVGLVIDIGILCLIFFFVNRTKINNRVIALNRLNSDIPVHEEQLAKGLDEIKNTVKEIEERVNALMGEQESDPDLENVLVRVSKFYQKIAEIRKPREHGIFG